MSGYKPSDDHLQQVSVHEPQGARDHSAKNDNLDILSQFSHPSVARQYSQSMQRELTDKLDREFDLIKP